MAQNDECDAYGIYPFVCTKFAIDDTERGCGDLWASGQNSALSLCGSCCVFCIPVTIALDLGFLVPVLGIWGGRKLMHKCKNKTNVIENQSQVIETQPQ